MEIIMYSGRFTRKWESPNGKEIILGDISKRIMCQNWDTTDNCWTYVEEWINKYDLCVRRVQNQKQAETKAIYFRKSLGKNSNRHSWVIRKYGFWIFYGYPWVTSRNGHSKSKNIGCLRDLTWECYREERFTTRTTFRSRNEFRLRRFGKNYWVYWRIRR